MKTFRNPFIKREQKTENINLMRHDDNKLINPAPWFHCTMKCEGNKLYDSPGNCPVCDMELVPIVQKRYRSYRPEHNGHSYYVYS